MAQQQQQQQWSRDYFSNRLEYCKTYFATVFVTWLLEIKHLVPQPEKALIDAQFTSIWEGLIGLSYHNRVSEDVVQFFREMQLLQDYIWSVKIDRRQA